MLLSLISIEMVDFPHEHARSRTFRWGEDGIAGVSDSHGLLNIAFSFWNEQDGYLKERLFGLSNPEGNHGESIKECRRTPPTQLFFVFGSTEISMLPSKR